MIVLLKYRLKESNILPPIQGRFTGVDIAISTPVLSGKNPSYSINLESLWSMVLVAIPAINRSIAGWLEWYFSFLLAVSTGCFEHFSGSHVHISWTRGSETST